MMITAGYGHAVLPRARTAPDNTTFGDAGFGRSGTFLGDVAKLDGATGEGTASAWYAKPAPPAGAPASPPPPQQATQALTPRAQHP
ncbi:hypothetical protein [Streptomyces sp. NPDC052693]|uniref:hypothetical protein n=1 Tax=Streptomyces sp. NPDC052693 TaxID=3155814 RepID=UPI003424AB8A